MLLKSEELENSLPILNSSESVAKGDIKWLKMTNNFQVQSRITLDTDC